LGEVHRHKQTVVDVSPVLVVNEELAIVGVKVELLISGEGVSKLFNFLFVVRVL